MRKIQQILVAVKSPGTQWQPAVAKATQIARATGARLELFMASIRDFTSKRWTRGCSGTGRERRGLRFIVTPVCN